MSVIRIPPRVPIDSNVYLVLGRSGILIDAGTGSDPDYLKKRVWDGLGGLRLSCVLLTHAHADHVGGLSAVTEEFGCPAYMGKADVGPYSSGDGFYMFADSLGVDVSPVPVKGVSEGEVFDVGDHRLRVIETPGHTAGGICLYDEATGAMFSGDTVFASGYGRTDMPGGSDGDMRASLRKLRNVNIGLLYPGHGPSAADGNESVRDALGMMGEYR